MNWRKWLDDFVISGKGILLATKERRFWYGFVPAFLFFGLLMNLLAGGTSKFDLIFALGFPQNLQIISSSFLAIFGIHQPFLDWLPIFLICILQGILIGLITFLWNKKKQNTENLSSAGIVAGLIALGAGCPTCGTTLLTPLLTSIFSVGGLTITGVVSTAVTVIAILIAIFSAKRLGIEAYVTIINEKYLARKKIETTMASKSPESRESTKSKEHHEKNP